MTALYLAASIWALSCMTVALGEIARAFPPHADKPRHLGGAAALTLLALPGIAYMALT